MSQFNPDKSKRRPGAKPPSPVKKFTVEIKGKKPLMRPRSK